VTPNVPPPAAPPPAALPSKATCLCLLTRVADDGTTQLLLGVKKRGFGKGRLVAPGGRLEAGESAADATVREMREESGLVVAPADLREAGLIAYRFPARPDWDLTITAFTADRFAGEPAPSDELDPAWHDAAALDYGAMWDDARYWLPRVLAGERVEALITFAADNETVATVEALEQAPDARRSAGSAEAG
jgi:8-oxo-dGTP diphosphatase